jgi:hypothetical protein
MPRISWVTMAGQVLSIPDLPQLCDITSSVSIVKPTRCTIFEFIEYQSTCFGQSFRPSSEVQDCTHSIRYMSYRLADCMLGGTRWNCSSILCPLASSQLTFMTYTWCCAYSLELLMMDGKTVQKSIPSIFNDESTGSFIWLTHVQHDSIIPCTSSYSVYLYLASHPPSCNKRHHTYGYVTRSKVNARSSRMSWRHNLTAQCASYDKVALRHTNVYMYSDIQ